MGVGEGEMIVGGLLLKREIILQTLPKEERVIEVIVDDCLF